MAAAIIGPRIRVATAFWISGNYGDRYHTFLQEEPGDGRTSAMALALKDDFGSRFEPLLILPGLLDEVMNDQRSPPAATVNQRSQLTVLSEILACGHVQELWLYGVAVPAKADPDASWAVPAGVAPGTVRIRVERLRGISRENMGSDAVETRVIEAVPDLPAFSTLYNNSVCNQLVSRLTLRLGERGWTSKPETLAATIYGFLTEWNNKGIFLPVPLRTEHLDVMTEIIYERLL